MDSINFDPYQHRIDGQNLSYCKAFLNYIKGIFGIAWLMLPYAFYGVGWPIGLSLSCLITIFSICGFHLLFHNMYELCWRRRIPFLTISEAMSEALKEGPLCFQDCNCPAELLVDIMLIIYHVGMGSVNVAFIAEILNHIVDKSYDVKLQIWIYMYLELIPFIIISKIRHFEHFIGFIIIFEALKYVGLLAVFFYLIFDHLSAPVSTILDEDFVLARYVGIFIYICCPIGMILNIEADMRYRKQFVAWNGVLNLSMLFTIAASMFISVIGTGAYGNKTDTILIKNLPMDNFINIIWLVLCALAVFFTHPICCYVAVDLTFHKYFTRHIQSKNLLLFEYLARLVVITLSVNMAVLLRYLDIIICFVAYSSILFLVLILPALMDICVYWDMSWDFNIVRNIGYVGIGSILSILGLEAVISERIKR